MSFGTFSKLFAISLTGGGLIAVPAIKFAYKENSPAVNLFLKNLSRGEKIFKEITKQQLKESSCKVLVTDVEDKESQIIVCPNNDYVTFLYSKKDSRQLEKIEKFSNSISTTALRVSGDGLDDAYNLQFQLAQTRSKASSVTTMKILKQNNEFFSKVKEVSLRDCKLESHKLLCKMQESRSTNSQITFDLSSSQDFSIN